MRVCEYRNKDVSEDYSIVNLLPGRTKKRVSDVKNTAYKRLVQDSVLALLFL